MRLLFLAMLSPTLRSSRGFTVVELVVVLGIMGILAAIAAPSWLALLNRIRLNSAQAQALSIMREAQVKAKQEKRVWEACFWQNETEKKVQWSVHPLKRNGQICENARWQNFLGEDATKIAIDMAGSTRSTLYNRNHMYRAQFTYKGRVNGQLGKITFKIRNQEAGLKRCVFVSTLLGAMRTAQNQECRSN